MSITISDPTPRTGAPSTYTKYYKFEINNKWLILSDVDILNIKNSTNSVHIQCNLAENAGKLAALAVRYSKDINLSNTYYDKEEKILYIDCITDKAKSIIDDLAIWAITLGNISSIHKDKWNNDIFCG